jgi:hypothetical protein
MQLLVPNERVIEKRKEFDFLQQQQQKVTTAEFYFELLSTSLLSYITLV